MATEATPADYTFAGTSLLLQFRSLIESSDWDVITPARQRQLDGGCIAVLAAATLYFFPILIRICLS